MDEIRREMDEIACLAGLQALRNQESRSGISPFATEFVHRFKFSMNGDTPVEPLRAMPIREIRDELNKRGVDMTGCLEKDDLVALLLANCRMAPSHADLPPAATAATVPVSGSRGSRPPVTGSGQDGWSGPSCKKLLESQVFYRCSNCSNKGEKMSHCSKCSTGNYCSKECQIACWPEHKKICKQLTEAKQSVEDTMGTGRVKALKAWADRNMHLLAYMAAATLWLPAPPLYASHVLHLELHCDDSSDSRPKFTVQNHSLITRERLCALTADEGEPDPLPPGPQDRMLVYVACTCCEEAAPSSPVRHSSNVMMLVKSVVLSSSSQTDLASGKLKLPSLADLTAELS